MRISGVIFVICSIFPAVYLGAINLRWFQAEYFFPIYAIASGIYLGACMVSAMTFPLGWSTGSFFRTWLGLCIQGAICWLAALLALAALSLTPLCVGQDNGDGHNTLALCMVGAFAAGLVTTPLVLMVISVCSAVGSTVLEVTRVGRVSPAKR